jgi:hypothetical protein
MNLLQHQIFADIRQFQPFKNEINSEKFAEADNINFRFFLYFNRFYRSTTNKSCNDSAFKLQTKLKFRSIFVRKIIFLSYEKLKYEHTPFSNEK